MNVVKIKKMISAQRFYVGIDPGAQGGLCFLCHDGVKPYPWYLLKAPEDPIDLLSWLQSIREQTTMAFLEKVGGYIGGAEKQGKGGGAANGSAMFKFGRQVGLVEMALTAAQIPYEEVTPAKWQRAIGISPKKKGEKKEEFKRRLKQHALKLFPGRTITLNTCDALLIAEYGRRKSEGLL